ncbi:hypothetical protein [Brevibacterium moorei]|uniref:hypothetical protein n=1 Tax=Brevibacterium moorei TaxID=2968457 RepID=UPI00211B8EFC|nr:hypothetical protein [Brevibacterium sp. 68QC2CO]MCQ9384427.1 hypothetical protein [Brevibacterium sp. 68QC2CO]
MNQRTVEPSWMLCPACTRTTYQLIRPTCVICQGAGWLRLGDPALSIYDPETVATAVRYALEAYARDIAADMHLSIPRQTLLSAALGNLIDAGLLWEETSRPAPPKFDTARELAEHVTGVQLTLFDMNVSDPALPLYAYTEEDRPLARGLPVLSASGHPSALSMLADPADPLGDTRRDAREHRYRLQRARTLLDAHAGAAGHRRRKVAA